MNKVLAVLSLFAVASVSALPLVFDGDLLKDGHPGLSVLHHVGHVEGSGTHAKKLRFLMLVPKLHAFLKDGFDSHNAGAGKLPVHHKFLDLDHEAGVKLVHLLGFSDCVEWHAVLLAVWDPAVGLAHKGFTAVKGADGKFALDHLAGPGVLADLADFVHLHTTSEMVVALVGKGLAAHHLTHLVHKKVAHLL